MKKKLSRKLVVTIVITTLLVVGGVSAALYNNKEQKPDTGGDQTTSGSNDIPGPTEAEKAEANTHKDDLAKRQDMETAPPTEGKKQVTPVIANATQNGPDVFVGGYVSGIYEDGGTCTFTFVKGSTQFTKTSEAFANASTTDCKNLTISRSEFPSSGEWTVTLTYNSSTASGVSQARQFNVQ